MALLVGDRGWILWLPCAYVIGATIDHALWVLIHECSHNLVFRSRTANRVLAIVANLPMVVPAALSFWNYHLLHHRHLGELELPVKQPARVADRVRLVEIAIGRLRSERALPRQRRVGQRPERRRRSPPRWWRP